MRYCFNPGQASIHIYIQHAFNSYAFRIFQHAFGELHEVFLLVSGASSFLLPSSFDPRQPLRPELPGSPWSCFWPCQWDHLRDRHCVNHHIVGISAKPIACRQFDMLNEHILGQTVQVTLNASDCCFVDCSLQDVNNFRAFFLETKAHVQSIGVSCRVQQSDPSTQQQ